MLLPVVFWALTSVLVKKSLIHLNSGVLTTYKFFFGFIALLIFTLLFHSFSFHPAQLGMATVMFIGMTCYYEGLRRLKVAQVGFIELASPFFAAGFGWLLFYEAVTLFQAFGVALLILGVYLVGKHEARIEGKIIK